MPKYTLIENYSILHPRRSNKLPFLSLLSDLQSSSSAKISFIFNSPSESRGLTRDLRLLEAKAKKRKKKTYSNVTTRQCSLISKISRQKKGDNQQENTNVNTSTSPYEPDILKYDSPMLGEHLLFKSSSNECNEGNQCIKTFKAFKEDELPIASAIKDIPSINWMKMDNDVTTDEEQLEYGKNCLLDHLKLTIDKEKSEIRYFQKHLSRRMNFAPIRKQKSKMY